MRFLLAFLMMSSPALADVTKVTTDKDVATATDAFVAAVENAGATVFATVDHGAAAEQVGSDIGAMRLVIFGNPQVGTPAMEIDPLAGLVLPLKVLIYEGPDGTVLAYESPAGRLTDVTGAQVSDEVTAPVSKALEALTSKAAE